MHNKEYALLHYLTNWDAIFKKETQEYLFEKIPTDLLHSMQIKSKKKVNTLSGHHCKSSPKETGLWTGVFFLSRFGSPSLLVEPLSLSNEAPSSHLRSRKRKTDSRSRNSSESLSKGRRRTGMQLGHTSGIKVSHSLVKTLQDATNSS